MSKITKHCMQRHRAVICQTFALDPSLKSQKPQILLDLGFVVRQLEDEVDFHLGGEPAAQVLTFLMLVVQNGLETCQARRRLHRWDRLGQKEA